MDECAADETGTACNEYVFTCAHLNNKGFYKNRRSEYQRFLDGD
jgi:hypothetical protein